MHCRGPSLACTVDRVDCGGGGGGGGALEVVNFRLNEDKTMTAVMEEASYKRNLISLWRRNSLIFRNPKFWVTVFPGARH